MITRSISKLIWIRGKSNPRTHHWSNRVKEAMVGISIKTPKKDKNISDKLMYYLRFGSKLVT
jgi:hypothetical protein